LETLFVVDVPSDKQSLAAQVPEPDDLESGAPSQETDTAAPIVSETAIAAPPEAKVNTEATEAGAPPQESDAPDPVVSE